MMVEGGEEVQVAEVEQGGVVEVEEQQGWEE